MEMTLELVRETAVEIISTVLFFSLLIGLMIIPVLLIMYYFDRNVDGSGFSFFGYFIIKIVKSFENEKLQKNH